MIDTILDSLTCGYLANRRPGAEDTPRPDNGNDATGPGASERALSRAVAKALGATGYSALRDLEIEMSNGIAVLWGRVPTYHQKQLAQAVAQNVEGVRGIANGIEVSCTR